MFKKLALVFILFFVVVAPIKAQTFDSEKAYQDYVFTQSNYDTAYKNFTDKRDIYLQNSTLTLKEDARVATLEMLKSRDDLYRVYLTAIRTKVSEIKGLTNDEKGGLYTKLDSEVLYYQGHKLTYTGNETLEDLFSINADVYNHYQKITLPFIYESLFMISYGQEVGIRQDHQTIYQGLIDFLNKKVAEQKLVIDPFNRWFLDIGSTIDSLKKNELTSKTQIQNLYSDNAFNPYSIYNKSIGTLTQSIDTLTKLNNFVTELMTAISNQI